MESNAAVSFFIFWISSCNLCPTGTNRSAAITNVKLVIIHVRDHVTLGIFSSAGSQFDFLLNHLNGLIYAEEQVERREQHRKGHRVRPVKHMLLLLLLQWRMFTLTYHFPQNMQIWVENK